jgi:hypothetical protein
MNPTVNDPKHRLEPRGRLRPAPRHLHGNDRAREQRPKRPVLGAAVTFCGGSKRRLVRLVKHPDLYDGWPVGLHVRRNPAGKQGNVGLAPSAARIAFVAVMINTGSPKGVCVESKPVTACRAAPTASSGEICWSAT